jgi:hypothetical protein
MVREPMPGRRDRQIILPWAWRKTVKPECKIVYTTEAYVCQPAFSQRGNHNPPQAGKPKVFGNRRKLIEVDR